MKGAIIGDIVGSVYEWDNIHYTGFELFTDECAFTDDTVMTIAVADWLTYGHDLVPTMQYYGRKYEGRGYGNKFLDWLWDDDPKPYGSWGNGAPMRASPCGWYADNTDECMNKAIEATIVTHDHVESIDAAKCVAQMIYYARKGGTANTLKSVARYYGYGIPNVENIRYAYIKNGYDVSSKGTMPAVMSALFNTTNFEDCLRVAVSIGGDTDTIACIACSIAEAMYGVPDELWKRAESYLDADLKRVVRDFYKKYGGAI